MAVSVVRYCIISTSRGIEALIAASHQPHHTPHTTLSRASNVAINRALLRSRLQWLEFGSRACHAPSAARQALDPNSRFCRRERDTAWLTSTRIAVWMEAKVGWWGVRWTVCLNLLCGIVSKAPARTIELLIVASHQPHHTPHPRPFVPLPNSNPYVKRGNYPRPAPFPSPVADVRFTCLPCSERRTAGT